MSGGTGNDSYYVDSMGDLVTEYTNEGTDAVYSSVSTTVKWLPEHVENLTLTGTAYRGDGNDRVNVVSGDSSANALYGYGGNDTLYGQGGDDLLDGGGGDDALSGGTGNDSYSIDSLGDQVIEYAGEGADTVYSSLSTSARWLPEHVENLTLTGTAYRGDGNDRVNVVSGNSSANALYGYGGSDFLYGRGGNDTLNGGAGADWMEGGTGNDRYYVDSLSDIVVEAAGEGTDTVYSLLSTSYKWLPIEVENLTLTLVAYRGDGNDRANVIQGSELNNALYGYAGNDALYGGGGADALWGHAGRDSLSGGAGADRFVLTALTDSLVGADRDVITDFNAAELDIVDLSQIDANLWATGDQAFTFIGASGFSLSPGELRFADGVLEGNVGFDLFADFQIELTGVTSLTESSFVL